MSYECLGNLSFCFDFEASDGSSEWLTTDLCLAEAVGNWLLIISVKRVL